MKTFPNKVRDTTKKMLKRLEQKFDKNKSPEKINNNMATNESIKPKSILKTHSQFENTHVYDNEDTNKKLKKRLRQKQESRTDNKECEVHEEGHDDELGYGDEVNRKIFERKRNKLHPSHGKFILDPTLY